MKSLLRSSILALIVCAGFAAVSNGSTPQVIPGSTSGSGKPCNAIGASFCAQ